MRIWAIGVLAAALALVGCDSGGSGDADASGPLKALVKQDVKVGSGPGAKDGDVLILDYTGKLADGSTFDSTATHGGAPFTVTLGVTQVIKGWSQGMYGLKEGGERKLSIPASLAYGANPPSEKIPANADLFFDVKCDKLIQAADVNNPVIDKFTKHGTGVKAKQGDTVTIIYKGYYANGTVFDAGGSPFDVKIGSGQAVPGMEYAMIGRQVGDKFRLTIPPRWGYGAQPGPGQNKDAWLMFDIQVTGIKH